MFVVIIGSCSNLQVSFGSLQRVVSVGTLSGLCGLLSQIASMTSIGLSEVQQGVDCILVWELLASTTSGEPQGDLQSE